MADKFSLQAVDVSHVSTGLYLLTSASVESVDGGPSWVFGGRSFSHSGDLVIRGSDGIEDIGLIDSSDQLFETTGEFHLTEIHRDRLRLSADYFGVQQLFVFDNNSAFIAATSYHLLLKIARYLDLPVGIDYHRSRRILDEPDVFHSRVAIEAQYCSVLAIYENLNFDADGPQIQRTALHDILYKRREYSPNYYANLIARARDEIVNNVEMVFRCPQFDAVVVDLSGGMDSRLLYAACTQAPQALVRQKIQINCQYSPSPSARHGGDLEVALELNSILGYPLLDNSIPQRRWLDLDSDEAEGSITINKISRNFGMHKNFNHITPKHAAQYCLNVPRVSGFVGECYRSADSKKPRAGTSYINYRNRYMTSRAFENILSPLASKNALEAAIYYQLSHPDDDVLRTVFDLLIALNPVLAKVRFHNASLRAFAESPEIDRCLNSPIGLSVKVPDIRDPRPTRLARYSGSPLVESFVFEQSNVESMLNSIKRYDQSYADIIERVDPSIADQNSTIIYRLWSLYFTLEILHGRG